MLQNYTRERKAIEAVDEAFEELKAGGVLLKVKKSDVRGQRAKLEDVVYTLTASPDFTAQMKAANKRQTQIETRQGGAVDN